MLTEHDVDWCLNCEDPNKMFLHLLKKHHGYYMGSIIPEQREIVKKSLDLQLEVIKMYLQKQKEKENEK